MPGAQLTERDACQRHLRRKAAVRLGDLAFGTNAEDSSGWHLRRVSETAQPLPVNAPLGERTGWIGELRPPVSMITSPLSGMSNANAGN
jgi:hypothetical protein